MNNLILCLMCNVAYFKFAHYVLKQHTGSVYSSKYHIGNWGLASINNLKGVVDGKLH